jgi:hypothetical protein
VSVAPEAASEIPFFGPLEKLIDKSNQKVRYALGTYAVGMSMYRMMRSYREKARSALMHTVTVPDTDSLYEAIEAWMQDHLPESAWKSLVVSDNNGGGRGMEVALGSSSERSGPKLARDRIRVDAQNRIIDVSLKGHKVQVRVDENTRTMIIDDSYFNVGRPTKSIVFHAWSKEGREAVLDLLDHLAEQQSYQPPVLYVGTPWSDWQRLRGAGTRDIDTVILPIAQKERIVGDLAKFLHAEGDYERLGVPWHRGYILEGPPGTGKTSFVRALATKFGLDVYFLPLADLNADTQLIRMIGNLSPKSILLIEDIDTVAVSHDREEESEQTRKGATLSGLLNALDGVVTPHGLITIITTNHAERLDPALMRPGRADMIETFGLATEETFWGIFSLVHTPEAIAKIRQGYDWQSKEMSPAEILQILQTQVGKDFISTREAVNAGLIKNRRTRLVG